MSASEPQAPNTPSFHTKASRHHFESYFYSHIAPTLHTGDVMLFHGTEFFSRVIEGGTYLWYWNNYASPIT